MPSWRGRESTAPWSPTAPSWPPPGATVTCTWTHPLTASPSWPAWSSAAWPAPRLTFGITARRSELESPQHCALRLTGYLGLGAITALRDQWLVPARRAALPIGAAAGSGSGCRETVPIGSFCGSFDMSGELTVYGSLGAGWPAGPSPWRLRSRRAGLAGHWAWAQDVSCSASARTRSRSSSGSSMANGRSSPARTDGTQSSR